MRHLLLLCFSIGLVKAQAPAVSNARIEQRTVTGDAVRYLRNLVAAEAGSVWFGYAAEAKDARDVNCCWNGDRCSGCRLEDGKGVVMGTPANAGPVKLEGSRQLFVLYRVQSRAVQKIRPVSGNCPLDAGGLRFVWLTGVSAEESVVFLAEQIGTAKRNGETDSALASIALHASGKADETLEQFAAPSGPEWLREKALFWLASARGERGLRALKNAADHEGSERLREKMMFDFSLVADPQGVDELLRYAKQDPAARVRSQAIFWLAQKAGSRAAGAIENAIESDPDTEVKTKAVFALGQMPNQEGIPRLIEVARNNRNREVRKQALFWLGQSGDARALAFIQEILER